ncbi:hypothetical protein [Pantoea septica]|uniref:hypothetical protein n=1 Tax=Pantoea septica TaxID=472695 RepID=UPI001C105339|nr:hypothetical protein [Pantoea septica]MBU5379509.1 hypothetical protein [Pantoea septica]
MDANGWSAIASAIAATGSVVVALMTYSQQRHNNKQSEIDKLVDRLISLAAKASSFQIQSSDKKRSFKDAADLTYALDSATFRILLLSRKHKLSDVDTNDLKAYFLNYLPYQITEEMRLKELPIFEMDATYGIDEVEHVEFLWNRSVNYLMRNVSPN